MVVHIVSEVIAQTISSYYYVPLIVGVFTIYYLNAWSSGKRTDRERDLHGRTILLTVRYNASEVILLVLTVRVNRVHQVLLVLP